MLLKQLVLEEATATIVSSVCVCMCVHMCACAYACVRVYSFQFSNLQLGKVRYTLNFNTISQLFVWLGG